MLEYFAVLTFGGLTLWAHRSSLPLKDAPIDRLVQEVLIPARTAERSFTVGEYTLKWRARNDSELLFVVVYQKMFPLQFAEDLLEAVAQEFERLYAEHGEKVLRRADEFEGVFGSIHRGFEQRHLPKQAQRDDEPAAAAAAAVAASAAGGAAPSAAAGDARPAPELKGKLASRKNRPNSSGAAAAKPAPVAAESEPARAVSPSKALEASSGAGAGIANSPEEIARLLAAKGIGKRGSRGSPAAALVKKQSAGAGGAAAGGAAARPEPGKELRSWGAGNVKDLDFSGGGGKEAGAADAAALAADVPEGRAGDLDVLDPDAEADDDDAGDESDGESAGDAALAGRSSSSGGGGGAAAARAPAAAAKKPSRFRGLFKTLQSIAGTRVLDADDLKKPLESLVEMLLDKNVASGVSEAVRASVEKTLLGRRLEGFSVASAVRKAMREALTQILTPHRRIDVLKDALAAKAAGRPYVMAFCGVNGVGKSTSLAKVAFWLLNNNLSVMIAACDTFRSGAVEQLQTHVKRLSARGHPVELFAKGYGKDPASVAQDAIRQARNSHINVVLVDTAGRMQDNEPLMRALAKLVGVNNPDVVLFVGEALVGNDSVDQVSKFNRALVEFGDSHAGRQIDGILLTKFDTVDDKVGTAVSMSYVTGKPIVFVGVGQSYTNLVRLNVGAVVSSLLR